MEYSIAEIVKVNIMALRAKILGQGICKQCIYHPEDEGRFIGAHPNGHTGIREFEKQSALERAHILENLPPPARAVWEAEQSLREVVRSIDYPPNH